MQTTFTIEIDADPHGSRAEEVIVLLNGKELMRWNVPGAGNARSEIAEALKDLADKHF